MPQRDAAFVGAGQCMWSVQQLPVAFADADTFQGEQWPVEQGAEFGEDVSDPIAVADGDDQHREVGVAAEEPGALSVPVGRAVDAQQCAGAGDAPAVQQVAHPNESRHSVNTFLPPDIDSQLRGLADFHGHTDGFDLPCLQPGPLPGDQAVLGQSGCLGQQRFDAAPGVDSDRDGRHILGQGQGAVGAKVVVEPDALDPTEQDAGGHFVPPIEVKQGISDEPVPHSGPFAEVDGQFQAVLVHVRVPTHRPNAAALTPRTKLTTTFSPADQCWRSSLRRWVSNIHVEKVVNEPTAAVPASNAGSSPTQALSGTPGPWLR